MGGISGKPLQKQVQVPWPPAPSFRSESTRWHSASTEPTTSWSWGQTGCGTSSPTRKQLKLSPLSCQTVTPTTNTGKLALDHITAAAAASQRWTSSHPPPPPSVACGQDEHCYLVAIMQISKHLDKSFLWCRGKACKTLLTELLWLFFCSELRTNSSPKCFFLWLRADIFRSNQFLTVHHH